MEALDLPEAVLRTILRHGMLAAGDRVAVAVSGGPDSVCLLHVLRALAPRLGVTVSGVGHVNHKLRGNDSEEDERFVAALAAQCGVSFFPEEARVAHAHGNLEQEARRARYSLWVRMIQQGRADKVATGHTRDDQAETVLFRFLRGSGLAGLAGILPVTEEGIIRPLLDVSRLEVEEFLRLRGIPWREDSSNRDPRFARNRIRQGLLPQLAREWNPNLADALAHTADLAREEEQWWRPEIARVAAELLVEAEGGVEVRASRLAALPKAVARRLVRHAMGRLEYQHVERVLELAGRSRGQGRLELPGLRVVRSFDWLRWPAGKQPECKPVEVRAPGKFQWAGGQICFEVSETKSPTSGCARLKLCGRETPAVLELRGWRVRDHYRPAGRSKDLAVAALFQRARVPSWRRDGWPIVTDGTRILWSRQFGPAAEVAAGDETGPALHIWEENNPGI